MSFYSAHPQQDLADVLVLSPSSDGQRQRRSAGTQVDDDFHFAALRPRPAVRAMALFLRPSWVMRQRRRQPSLADVSNEAAAELEALAKAEASASRP